jgi:hypothetical protein
MDDRGRSLFGPETGISDGWRLSDPEGGGVVRRRFDDGSRRESVGSGVVCGYQSDGVCCENRANLELADVARQGL